MSVTPPEADTDAARLEQLGYRQELRRRLGGFSNFAVSFAVICILAGGVTSFHLGLAGVGGAAIGLGWPLVTLFALAVAATMGQVASAFPTAGGLYHWAAILGGRGWGWATAWLNLLGLVTVAAAINVGAYHFLFDSLELSKSSAAQALAVLGVTLAQAALNRFAPVLTTRLTDASGYLIVVTAIVLTAALFAAALGTGPADWGRLVHFDNLSGVPADAPVWPASDSMPWLFALGLLLPAYTLTGYDASAHVGEETRDAGSEVPRGIVRSVLVAGMAGWAMLAAAVVAAPDLRAAVERGSGAFVWIVRSVLAGPLALGLIGAIVAAQFLCGLATVTSASRMAYAFARDGGLPARLASVNPRTGVPGPAVWAVALSAAAFTLYAPVYDTIALVCTVLLYVSYVIPTALGLWAFNRTWTKMGPWTLGRWYRPLAALALLGCLGLIALSVLPPNERAGQTLLIAGVLLAAAWLGWARRTFRGPPARLLDAE